MEIYEINEIGVFLPINGKPWWMVQWEWSYREKHGGVWPIGLPPGLVQLDATKMIIFNKN